MADTENHVSMLPQLARNGSAFRALQDVSASDNNTRNALPAPTTAAGHKRQGSNLLEPAPKRKTLAERAGEPIRQLLPAPKSTTTVGETILPKSNLQAYRSVSASSTSSYRSTSNSSRATSYSGISGSGIRPPAQSISNLARPKTALAKDRADKTTESRPNTSLGQHGGSYEVTRVKRMAPPSLACPFPKASGSSNFAQTTLNSVSHNTAKRLGIEARPAIRRQSSITSKLSAFSLSSSTPQRPHTEPASPSRIPRPATPAPSRPVTPSALPRSCQKSPSKQFLTRFSNTEAIDVDEQYNDFKRMFQDAQNLYKDSLVKVTEAKDENNVYKTTIDELKNERSSQTSTIIQLTSETEMLKYRLEAAERALLEQNQKHEAFIEDFKSQHKQDIETLRSDHRDNIEQLKNDQRNDTKELKTKFEEELQQERTQRIEAMNQASTQGVLEKQKQQMEMEMKDREIRAATMETERIMKELERERSLSDELRRNLGEAGNHANHLEAGRLALQKKIEYLESDNKSQSEAYAQMEQRMNEALAEADRAVQKLRKEETLRRKLHNQVQELKGNIRVFCRVRPTLPSEEPEELARMNFPDVEDSKEIEIKGQEETNSLGKITTKTYPFSFDRVFDPTSDNNQIFDEISQLVQSALDGFNVCIFAYGQTGSGKTYTMSSDDGMIPRALRQIYSTSKDLEERGWKYSMEGSFVEVYNEELRDLLGKEGEAKKHEIRHDMIRCETTITDVTSVNLDSQDHVEEILERAMAKRSVAATKANERSSRSHSVFILKLIGENSVTGEKSKGTLNLVDLAGSERLSHSKVEGQRLKETQSINKSLSCLGDVIGALGQQNAGSSDGRSSSSGMSGTSGAHIPYRNSKLTYLLQFSLGGNSKTLMFVMVAPEKKCLGETITSLKFAEKVSRTRVGVAKKVR